MAFGNGFTLPSAKRQPWDESVERSHLALGGEDSGRHSAGVFETYGLGLESKEASFELSVLRWYVPGSVWIAVRGGVVRVIFNGTLAAARDCSGFVDSELLYHENKHASSYAWTRWSLGHQCARR
jgi:hypothetical protein